MNERFLETIATELHLRPRQVEATAQLLDEGATIPFIARYRKELTDSLDEVAVTSIRDRLEQLEALAARREAIVKSLEERSLLTDELAAALEAAQTLGMLEDIYQPYRPKRRTRAMIAREKGLEPLADLLWGQDPGLDPPRTAETFVDAEKGVESVEQALAGARDILAERVSDDTAARTTIRALFASKGVLRSWVAKDKEAEGAKFKDYFDWNEPAVKAPSHRILAIRRGEAEGFLYSRLMPPEEEAVALLKGMFVTNASPAADQVTLAVEDGYKRLLEPSLETEARMEAKQRADAEAIRVFASNLRELLLAPPLGSKNVLGIDPGFRTGCKVVCLDRQGKLLHHDVIFIEQSDRQLELARQMVLALCARFEIEAVAIGNGTASRETEAFVRSLELPASIALVVVNESGASVYSASEVAREEFSDQDITVRGAVSIGRRLMDPLAELVKIDPKSIGVGQYQHDVDQKALKRSLDEVVSSCVNAVGVEVNTSSKQLLSYVSGLNGVTAENLIAYRNQNGPFRSRRELLKVPRLGPKAFEQAAGFLRIRDGQNPLDASAVHPESYPIVEKMAGDLDCTVGDLMKKPELRTQITLERYVADKVGLPTLKDILDELAKPGRDPRERFEAFSFAEGVTKLQDLTPGMRLPGIVTNVTAFGAFVDIGVHQDGLVHISQLADQYVKDPATVVKVHQRVQVTVLEVDLDRKRIGLSMKSAPEPGAARAPRSGPADAVRRPDRPAPQPQSPARTPATDWFTLALNKAKREKMPRGGGGNG
ncbi:MAG TPA: Tex family protein [Candidatus Methylomirabilis sp.]